MAEMRMIDAAPLIEYFSGGDAAKSLAESISDQRFVEALKNAPVVDMGSLRRVGWVPVTEILPDGECIAIGYQNEMLIGWVYEDKNSETGYAAESESEILREVTHWMPLPEPPKE